MECMSDDTWKSHRSCVELSKSVKKSKRVERRLCCNVFFALWHTITTKSRDVASMVLQFSIGYNQYVFQKCRHIIDEYDRLDSHIHRDTLINWWFAELRLSRMRAATKDLIAADKAKKVEAITMQISDPMSYKDSAKFWQLLHSAVPSLNKKTSIKPIASLKLEDGNMGTDYNSIRARWQRHFASIELGEIMEYDDLCQKVRCARNHTLSVTSLIDLPTIFHTEEACHRVKIRSAAGPDRIPGILFRHLAPSLSRLVGPMYFKSAALAQEPLTFKESTQAELFKGKGEQSIVGNSRGVTCANSISKPYNMMCRSRLLNYVQPWLLDTQVGGKEGGGTDLASHTFRSFMAWTALKKRNMLAIFVDQASAFYRTIRSLVV